MHAVLHNESNATNATQQIQRNATGVHIQQIQMQCQVIQIVCHERHTLRLNLTQNLIYIACTLHLHWLDFVEMHACLNAWLPLCVDSVGV